jgi:hypothetical protein
MKKDKILMIIGFSVTLILLVSTVIFWLDSRESKIHFDSLLSDYNKLIKTNTELYSRINSAENKIIEQTGNRVLIDESLIKGQTPIYSIYQNQVLVCAAEVLPNYSNRSPQTFCEAFKSPTYELKVQAGEYYVYGMELCDLDVISRGLCKNNQSYYTKKVKCFFDGKDWEKDKTCNEEKVLVKVEAGKSVENINIEDINFLEGDLGN